MVHLMTAADHVGGLSLRKAQAYTDCSRNTYYYNKKKGPIENALVSHKEIVVPDDDDDDNNNNKPTVRADNGSQYTSNAFRKSMSVLGIKLEHIACNTPEQNGHIESFHKTLKKEYIWPYDFRTYQEAEVAIRDAFVDYNRDRIHSSLGYLTPYEFISKWKQEHQSSILVGSNLLLTIVLKKV